MNNKDILDMCRRLASKYYNHQDYDDIVSEGVVLCLNMRAEGIKEPSKLYYSARTAMFQYVNVSMSNFSYPKGMAGREAVLEDTIEYVVSDDVDIPSEDLYGSYELKNSIENLKKFLTGREWKVFMILYNNNNNLTDTAEVLKLSKQRVEQIRNKIRDKLVTICELDI